MEHYTASVCNVYFCLSSFKSKLDWHQKTHTNKTTILLVLSCCGSLIIVIQNAVSFVLVNCSKWYMCKVKTCQPMIYHNVPKSLDRHRQIWAKCVDSDQTAPRGVWSGPTLFAVPSESCWHSTVDMTRYCWHDTVLLTWHGTVDMSTVLCQQDSDRTANSEGPDQTVDMTRCCWHDTVLLTWHSTVDMARYCWHDTVLLIWHGTVDMTRYCWHSTVW